jgi:hypothetical protein
MRKVPSLRVHLRKVAHPNGIPKILFKKNKNI